jgi:hypothetical protein
MHIDQFYFSTFFGGSTNDFRPTKDERIFFDDFEVSDSFITAIPTRIRPRRGLSSPRVSRSAAVFDPGWIGSRLVVRDLAGRNLSSFPIRSERTSLPAGLPSGLVFLAVPEKGWSSISVHL